MFFFMLLSCLSFPEKYYFTFILLSFLDFLAMLLSFYVFSFHFHFFLICSFPEKIIVFSCFGHFPKNDNQHDRNMITTMMDK